MPNTSPSKSSASPAGGHLSRKAVWMLALCVLLLVGLVVAWKLWRPRAALPPGVSAQDYELARKMFASRYRRSPDRDDVFSWLAESFLARERLAEAISCFAEIPTVHPEYGHMARYQQGRALLTLHRAIEAEEQLREFIAAEEADRQVEAEVLIDARQRLRHILEVELRFEERRQLLQGVVDRGEADAFETIACGFQSLLRWNGSQAILWLEQFHTADPANERLNVALARYRTSQGRTAEALQIIEPVVRQSPDNLRARSVWLECLREAGRQDEFSAGMRELPPQGPHDPWLLLILRGHAALESNSPRAACNAFQQLLQEDRTCIEAWNGLAQAALLLKQNVVRGQALKLVQGLARIQTRLGKGVLRPDDPSSFLDVADICAELALDREGLLFARFARKLAPQDQRSSRLIHTFEARLKSKPDAELIPGRLPDQ